MTQRKLLVVLGAGTALLLLLAATVTIGPSVLIEMVEEMFGANEAQRASAGEDRPGATGEDEHGYYEVDGDGRRIYTDEHGRRYHIGPDGQQVYIDSKGRPIARPSDKAKSLERVTNRQVGSASSATGKSSGAAASGTKEAGDEDAGQEEKKASVGGVVHDDGGNALPGATVTAEGDGKLVSATADKEGAFRVNELVGGVTLTLTASDGRGNSSKPFKTRLAPGHTQLKAPLVVPASTTIGGIVQDATGAPLAGVGVQLLEDGKVLAGASTTGDGAFEFRNLTPAAHRLVATLDGYVPRILNNVHPPARLTVTLEPGAAITGVVRDAQGEPVAQARVACDLYSEPAQHFHTEAFTDEAGFYAVKCQPESQHNTVTVVAAGRKSQQRYPVRSGAEGVNFVLEPSGNVILRGQLMTTTGLPVVTATFRADNAAGKYTRVAQSVGPDAEGKFWAEVEPAGVRLRVSSPGRSDVSADYQPQAGEEINLGILFMDAGYAVHGVIREKNEPKLPIAGADVIVGGAKVKTGDDGAYRIEGIASGEFIVRVLHQAYLGSAIRVTPKAGEYDIERDIELGKAGFEARVRVTDEETGEPLPGVTATLPVYTVTQTTGADGLITFTGLSSMRVDAVFEKPGYAKVAMRVTADVTDKVAEAPPQQVIMKRGATIAGTCTSGGSPLPGATEVEVWDASKLVAKVQTDTQGAYTTDALPLGTYFVSIPAYHYTARKVELEEEGATFNVELGPVSHLRGRMLRHDNSPHANAGVYVYRRDNLYYAGTLYTGPDGSYSVDNLFPGEWVFCALKTQGDVAAQFAAPVSVAKAGISEIDIKLPRANGVMRGRVMYPDGQPVRNARVAVTNLSAQFERALLAAYVVTDENGWYTAERLENGAQMIARVGGYHDGAETGTAFSETVLIAPDDTPVAADIVVAPQGISVTVPWRVAHGGPLLDSSTLAYLLDGQGRVSGLYFGGGRFTGNLRLNDVVPGSYTLVLTHRGCKRAQVQFTVGAAAPTGVEVILEPEERG